jgi:LPXTG-motif cell wall-anchored protein
MRTLSPARAALLAAAAVGLTLSSTMTAAAVPAMASGDYTVPLHQQDQLPITAANYPGGGGDCPGVPANKDGWNFVLPGNSTVFTKLTVTFDVGGTQSTQVLTTFGPPSDKHANVASAPGAKLIAASADVNGGQVSWFNLSHTCAASQPGGGQPSPSSPAPGGGQPSPSSPAPGGGQPSPSSPAPTGGTPTSPAPTGGTPTSPAPTGPSATSSAPAGGGTSKSPSAGASSTASSTASGAATPSPSASHTPAGSSASSLAFTGTNVIGILAAGLALVGLGSVLVMRRRKAAGLHR